MTNTPEASSLPNNETPETGDAEHHWNAWKGFSLEAYGRFHTTIERIRQQHPGLTRYDIVDRISATKGTFAWWWSAACEVRESINSLNAWGVRLHEWQAWNRVISEHDGEEDRWDVLHHFAEPIAFFCMLQPSSFADRLALTAENLLHQTNQRICPMEPDRLVQDKRPGKPLRRSDRKKQLTVLGGRWSAFPSFQRALNALDGAQYSDATRNFRDLAVHSFSPRLLLGQISRAIRSIVPRTDMVRREDGRYVSTEHPTEKTVRYSMVTYEPLSLEDTIKANLEEYQRAKAAMECFITLVVDLCDAINRAPTGPEVSPAGAANSEQN